MKALPLLLVGVICALLAASATWFALQGSRVSAPRAAAAEGAGTAAGLQDANDALRSERERLERENARLRRELEARSAETERNDQPKPDNKATSAQPTDTNTKPSGETTAKPTEPAPENAAMKATRNAAIAEFHGKDEGAADDAMKLLANLAKNGDVEARKVLLEALKSENPYMRELAVEAVGIMANPDDLPLLEAALKDSESKVREEAIDWIGNYPPEKAGPILSALLGDADPRIVRTAIDRLGDMKYEAAKPDLIRLAGGTDENVAVEAARRARVLSRLCRAKNSRAPAIFCGLRNAVAASASQGYSPRAFRNSKQLLENGNCPRRAVWRNDGAGCSRNSEVPSRSFNGQKVAYGVRMDLAPSSVPYRRVTVDAV